MFGNKQAKQARLQHLEQVLQRQDKEVGVSELARTLGVSRHTVMDDLVALEARGVKLCEHKGKLSLLKKWFKT
jgi:DeoR/GlpR family transcriptional regulator of sugar metabolism